MNVWIWLNSNINKWIDHIRVRMSECCTEWVDCVWWVHSASTCRDLQWVVWFDWQLIHDKEQPLRHLLGPHRKRHPVVSRNWKYSIRNNFVSFYIKIHAIEYYQWENEVKVSILLTFIFRRCRYDIFAPKPAIPRMIFTFRPFLMIVCPGLSSVPASKLFKQDINESKRKIQWHCGEISNFDIVLCSCCSYLPSMTVLAPPASALVMSPLFRIPPSAIIGICSLRETHTLSLSQSICIIEKITRKNRLSLLQ